MFPQTFVIRQGRVELLHDGIRFACESASPEFGGETSHLEHLSKFQVFSRQVFLFEARFVMIVRRCFSSHSPAGMGWEFNRVTFASLKGRDFIDMMDNTPEQLKALLDGAHVLKRMYKVEKKKKKKKKKKKSSFSLFTG
jgi:hypothetical protein